MPTIVHFEIPTDDVERSKNFYTDLFGWKIEKWPGPVSQDMEYWTITTTDEKEIEH
jgi:predicted enzyme related to lactoylglutathione lyase